MGTRQRPLGGVSAARRTASRLQFPAGANRVRRRRDPRRGGELLAAAALQNATPTWTLANHDVGREVSRYGGGEIGLRRAKAMAVVMLALPGVVFLYNGQELGLPDVDLPDEVLQDPTWERSGRTERGRDGCRVPIPWSGNIPRSGSRRVQTPGCRCRRNGRR